MNYISGLFFSKISNWNLCPRYLTKFEPENIKENDLVFINLDYFNDFVNKLLTSKLSNKPINKIKRFVYHCTNCFWICYSYTSRQKKCCRRKH